MSEGQRNVITTIDDAYHRLAKALRKAGRPGDDFARLEMLWRLAKRDTIRLETQDVPFRDCPVGLFVSAGELCLMTEYADMDGHADAYVVASGEYFWGGTTKKADRDQVLVTPAKVESE